MPTPGERKCWDCGNIAHHEDNITPHVLCKKCGSQDTRLTRQQVTTVDASTTVETLGESRLQGLVRRAVAGLKHIGTFGYLPGQEPHPLDCNLAGRVSHVFGIGMSSAIKLCRECGEDPEYRATQE